MLLVRTVASRQIVVALSDQAKSHGIRRDMTLSQARALCASVVHTEHEPDRDAVALEALARWMMRFSPVVSVGWEGEAPAEPSRRLTKTTSGSADFGELSRAGASPSRCALFLDISGCEKAFKGLDNLLALVEQSLTRLGITNAIAVAPTPGAAWALTFSKSCIDKMDATCVLNDLHPYTLRLEPQIVDSLVHLGLISIGQIEKLPRDSLPARFGQQLLTRLDQMFGRIPEPLVPVEPFAPIREKMDFEAPIDNPEVIDEACRILVGKIMEELAKRGRGARVVEAEYLVPYAPSMRQTIRLSRASRDAKNLLNLLRCGREQGVGWRGHPAPAPTRSARMNKRGQDAPATEYIPPDGFIGIRLTVTSSERISDEQIKLLGADEFCGQLELDRLIERLGVRMGDRGIEKVELIESHIPEKTSRATDPSQPLRHGGHVRVTMEHRPLQLLSIPEEIGVIVSPSHDLEGSPVSFTSGDEVHRLAHVTGPERIAGQWWEGHDKTRDYFDVEDESGKRFWIFRVRETRRWYLHGCFA